MIVFHEGLPGSGKSYEAIVTRIVPALTAGRPVDAYVEGLDHAKLAEVAGITEDKCRELLRPLTREQVPEVHKISRDNALIVLDEAQNFWGNRAKLSAELTQYVTEHRHRGQDIILMGQDMRDVHTLWRRRVELKLRFMKLSALGAGKRYSVGTFRCVGQDEFEKVGTQVTKYDPKFFGTYKSHVSDDTNKADYKESRATLWRHPLFRYGLPLAVLGGVWGIWKAYAFFQPETHNLAKAKPPAQVQSTASVPAPGASAPVVVVKAPDTRTAQEVRFAKLSSDHRIRLAGLLKFGNRMTGIVEWLDAGTRVVERLTLDQLRDLGVGIAAGEGYVRLQLGGWSELATMWPLEELARVSDARTEKLKQPEPMAAPEPAGWGSLGGSPTPPAREPSAPLTEDRPRGRRAA